MMQMKQGFTISFVVALLLTATTQMSAQNRPSSEQIIQKVANKLASVKTLKYKYERELNYPSEGYLNKTSADSFLDLRPVDSPLGFRFQFSNDELLAVYNGSEKFIADKKNKRIRIENDPPLKSFGSFSFFYYSPLTLKNVLPKIVADKTIQKKLSVTKVNGSDHYVIEFDLTKVKIDPILGEIYVPKTEHKSIYRLTVDKKTLLPTEFFAGNDQNQDFAKINFADMKEGGAEPAELTWYYSTYSNEYTLEKPEDRVLIKSGQIAPGFNLARYRSDSQVSLGQYKGKVVLLEFWIVNCGFCIAAVPKLNSIEQEFRDKNFEFISINIHDSQNLIDIFRDRNKPVYQILMSGESTSSSYGVSAYPSFVLIDKDGKVVYSNAGLDEKEMETIISKNL